jgi:hypothetical protein
MLRSHHRLIASLLVLLPAHGGGCTGRSGPLAHAAQQQSDTQEREDRCDSLCITPTRTISFEFARLGRAATLVQGWQAHPLRHRAACGRPHQPDHPGTRAIHHERRRTGLTRLTNKMHGDLDPDWSPMANGLPSSAIAPHQTHDSRSIR